MNNYNLPWWFWGAWRLSSFLWSWRCNTCLLYTSRLPSTAAASNEQLQSSLVVLGGLAAFLVFVVMAVQYLSLIHISTPQYGSSEQ
ncbi:hypothetical protein IQ225_10310 [Synechocystis salina LEGE 06155]|nr:hypothetical protein [Synechocystis salina LEGE 06155]MBE9175592.1 hypothetical protein [Synechocystis salina LEGE 06155]MBE9175593.1 hypothetical protein [Synechocystis salina LEGE 06155]MBE9175594.1 hypothetical protein [Synechocystis salina LEGE 06155]MBE9175595.1 hypothetical protein [Synechocystis salina LEGE 06155]